MADKIEFMETKKELNKHNKLKSTIKLLIVIVISFLIGIALMYLYSLKNPKIVTKNRTISNTKVTEEAMEDAINKIYDAVICIEVLNDDGTALSTGTGFIYQKDDKYGYVLTNAHVITDSKNVQGTLSNNNTTKLTLLGKDSYMDLAVLRMDAKDVLKVASLGTSKNTKIGNTVFTVGSPMGSSYAGTVTKGILSGKERLIETNTSNSFSSESYIVKVIQTDAAISPGNSGGPLVNLAGDVIGITSLKLVDTQVEGMGFAIPMEDALSYIDILEKGEEVKRPIVGVQILDLTNPYLLYRSGITIDSSIKSGVVLVSVKDGYPAEEAGLKAGDVITKVGSEKVTTVAQFKYELYKHKIDDTIEITYIRNGKEHTTKVKLTKSE